MNKLIIIKKAKIQDKETLAVNTRELYKALELGDGQYSRWIQNNLLKDEVFKENSDFIRVRHKVEGNNLSYLYLRTATSES